MTEGEQVALEQALQQLGVPEDKAPEITAVSYTHLTLPTKA